MEYYRRIKETREDKDIKQGEMAAYLKIKQAQLSRYESGKNEIPIRYLIKIADLLNVSTDYLLERTDEPAINKGLPSKEQDFDTSQN